MSASPWFVIPSDFRVVRKMVVDGHSDLWRESEKALDGLDCRGHGSGVLGQLKGWQENENQRVYPQSRD
jgi:hypothetical protein